MPQFRDGAKEWKLHGDGLSKSFILALHKVVVPEDLPYYFVGPTYIGTSTERSLKPQSVIVFGIDAPDQSEGLWK